MIFHYIIVVRLGIVLGCHHGLTGSAIGHRSIAPGFKPRPSYVRRVFRLSLWLITFGDRSTHLAYLVPKSGRETATFTFLWIVLIRRVTYSTRSSTLWGNCGTAGSEVGYKFIAPRFNLVYHVHKDAVNQRHLIIFPYYSQRVCT